MFAANRQNYAQDLQISSRGFGARATFGVRGVRLYQDDIPATMPDGQGQTGSFSLLVGGAHRGAARAVLDALRQRVGRRHLGVHRERHAGRRWSSFAGSVGSYDTYNVGVKATGTAGGVGYVGRRTAISTPTATATTRRRRRGSSSTRSSRSTRARRRASRVIGSSQHQPDTQDPLGLTQRASGGRPAPGRPGRPTLFNTRKTINQLQGGVVVDQAFAADDDVRVTGYGGHRADRTVSWR